jgi:hypothetical protein
MEKAWLLFVHHGCDIVTIFSLPVDPNNVMDSTRPRRLIALFGMVVFLALVYASSNVRS